jgi:hypothetical protein
MPAELLHEQIEFRARTTGEACRARRVAKHQTPAETRPLAGVRVQEQVDLDDQASSLRS